MKRILLLAALVGWSVACSNKDLDLPQPGGLTEKEFYKSEADAIQAVNAAYSALAAPNLYGRMMHVAQDLLSDESEITPTTNANWAALRRFEAGADNEVVAAIWTGCYQGIHRANLVLDRVPNIDMNAGLKDRLLAEARFLRGLYYFMLVTTYGDVPLQLSVVNVSQASQPRPSRTPADQVYEAILQDFAEAEKKLPESYTGNDLGRATRGAAKGFQAKALLYRADRTGNKADYAAAAKLFGEIIGSGVYELMPDYRQNFTAENENNRESLFEVQFSTTVDPGAFCDNCGTGSLRALEMGVRGRANNQLIPSEAYVQQFEADDSRLLVSVFGPPGSVFDGQDYFRLFFYNSWSQIRPRDFAVRKYQKDAGNEFDWNTGSGINFRLMRFADVLLMYAEASVRANGLTEPALEALNRVRARAGMAAVSAGSTEEFMQLLEAERMRELGLEGSRWRDLVRWKRAASVLEEQGRLFDPRKHYLFPIPASERRLNPNLVQNPGWD